MSDARTREYTGGAAPNTPLAIVIGESIHTRGGQIALLAIVNAAVRNHPTLYVKATDVPILGPAKGTTHTQLAQLGTATAAANLQIIDDVPRDMTVIGIGRDVTGADLYIGADRFTGEVSTTAIEMSADPSSVWGGALGAMLAANSAFRSAIGLPVPTTPSLSLWTLDPHKGGSGPADHMPINVGTAWLIGAGGVGSSIAWWLNLFGVEGVWVVIDHERVDVTNLNRSLGMFVADYEGDNGIPRLKAHVAADLCGATPFPNDWTAWAATDPPAPDIIIPAANDRGVRGTLATYSHPMAITGTTSKNWTAELHLYRAGIDGCIECRHPTSTQPEFACSTSTIPTEDGGSTDAALSFLSGSAGLLTTAALARLQHGEPTDATNHWQLSFQPARRSITTNLHTCTAHCHRTLAPRSRRQIFGSTRWAQDT